MAKITKLKFFISSSMGESVPLELRTVLQTLSDRYELFEFEFIEESAAPGSLDNRMRQMITQCDGLIMIFHKLEKGIAKQARKLAKETGAIGPGIGLVKAGVEFEYQFAIEVGKPIFLFVQQQFFDDAPSKKYLQDVWTESSLISKTFGSSQECAAFIEQSLFNYIVGASREKLRHDGQKKLSTSAGGGPGGRS